MRIILFGDSFGIPELFSVIPRQHIAAMVLAGIRPDCVPLLKDLASSHDIPLLIQPKATSYAYSKFIQDIAILDPELFWVHSYSMLIRPEVLKLATFGGLNLHYALLPKYRGCNPIQWALIHNEKEMGVTLHEISNEFDEGAIVDQTLLPIHLSDTTHSIMNTLHQMSRHLIKSNLEKVLSGKWTSQKQNSSESIHMRRRTPADSEFSWDEPIIDIFNKIRALLPPIPAAFFVDEDGLRNEMQTFLSLAEVATQKLQKKLIQYHLNKGRFSLSVITGTQNKYTSETIRNSNNSLNLTLQVKHETTVVAELAIGNFDWRSDQMSVHLNIYDKVYKNDCIKLIGDFCKQEFKVRKIALFEHNTAVSAQKASITTKQICQSSLCKFNVINL